MVATVGAIAVNAEVSLSQAQANIILVVVDR